MPRSEIEILNELIARYPVLAPCKKSIQTAYEMLRDSYEDGKKLLVCGNGGSAADSEHIVGELMKGFKSLRPLDKQEKQKLEYIHPEMGALLSSRLQSPLPAISLVGHPGLTTAFSNDVDNGGKIAFAQQAYGLGNAGDVLLGITTSGNSENVLLAAVAAKAKGLFVLGLTGQGGGKLAELADVIIAVPEKETFKVQELHLPIYHCLCLMLERHFYGE
ncbi:MAG: SIS domain-containing protein [Bacilli bacterium]|nr:SIS domain-containing protein [Bacilli bacterium]